MTKISIIILTKDKVDYLKRCLESLEQFNNMTNAEVIVVSNNSSEKETFKYFEELKLKSNYKIIEHNIPFNYSALNNYGVRFSKGDYLLFLNNDMEFIQPNTINILVEVMSNTKVGVVGANLLYPDNTIQHVGVNIHKQGAWQPYRYGSLEELPHLLKNREVSAVIGACLLIRRNHFEEIGGFDENLKVVMNDIDLCMKMKKYGLKTICTNELIIHHEGISRGKSSPPEDVENFISKWQPAIENGDDFDISLQISKQHIQHYFNEFNIIADRPTFIFGTGEKGRMGLNIIEEFNFKGFLDNDKRKWGERFEKYNTFNPNILNEMEVKPYIIIASYYYKEIREQLEKLGFENYKDFYRLY